MLPREPIIAQDQNGQGPLQNTQGPQQVHGPVYFFSAGAIAIKALLEIVEANTEAMNDMAKQAEQTAIVKGDMAVNVAQSTYDSYNADAESLKFQMGEQIASAASSGVGAFGSVIALWRGAKAEKTQYSQMTDLNKQVNEKNLTANIKIVAGQPQPPKNQDVVAQELASLRDQVKQDGGAFFRARPPVNGLNTQYKSLIGGQGHSLEQILQSGDDDDLLQMKDQIGNGTKNALKAYTTAQSHVQSMTQLLTTLAQAGSSAATAGMKSCEQQQMVAKAIASAAQSQESAGLDFMKETAQSERDQSSSSFQSVQTGYTTIADLVGFDARG